MRAFFDVVLRDLRLALRQSADSALVIVFFVLIGALFPFAVGPEPNLLARIAPGVVWVAAQLAVLLSLERLFLSDYEDGNLDLLALGVLPLELAVLAKALAHWLVSGLPLIVTAPLITLLYNLPLDALPILLLALLLGTPSLSLIGAIGAALTLGARRGGVLIPLLVLPLAIPALIFGMGAVDAVLAGQTARPHLLLLAAALAISLAVAPPAAAAALRQALD